MYISKMFMKVMEQNEEFIEQILLKFRVTATAMHVRD